MKDKLLEILCFYGLPHQLKYIHSEYYELDEAIHNFMTDETYYDALYKEDVRHITEEISDVMVMLKQFQYYFNIKDKEINDIMNFKIDRQLERIKDVRTNDNNQKQ